MNRIISFLIEIHSMRKKSKYLHNLLILRSGTFFRQVLSKWPFMFPIKQYHYFLMQEVYHFHKIHLDDPLFHSYWRSTISFQRLVWVSQDQTKSQKFQHQKRVHQMQQKQNRLLKIFHCNQDKLEAGAHIWLEFVLSFPFLSSHLGSNWIKARMVNLFGNHMREVWNHTFLELPKFHNWYRHPRFYNETEICIIWLCSYIAQTLGIRKLC